MGLSSVLASVLVLFFSLATTRVSAFIDFDNLTAQCDDAAGRSCGNGVCQFGTCVCDASWSKFTDFVEFEDCSLSTTAMYILWSINIVALCWTYFKSAHMIMIRFEIFFETRKARKGYGLCQNKGLIGVLVYFGISTPFHFIMAVSNLAQPDIRIGFDALPTFCFFIAKLGFYIPAFIVQSTMFAATLKGDRSQERLVKINTVLQAVVSTSSIIVGGFAFITLGAFQQDRANQVVIMRAYYFCQGLTLMSNAFGSWLLKRKVNAALDRVKDISTDNRSKGIREKINQLQGTVIKQGTIQGLIYILFGAIPFLINKHDYFLPISWPAMPVLGKQLAHQIMTDKNSKTLMERLGLKKTGTGQGSSSAHGDKPTSLGKVTQPMSGGGPASPTSNNRMVASSMIDSVNPSYAPSVTDFKKKKKRDEKQKSSFLSEGALLEELLDPDHPLNARFVKFVEQRYAQNEVALLSLTLKYRATSDTKERAKLGKQIMSQFIEENAPRAVDLPSDVKEIIHSTAKRQQWVPTTFDQIRRTLMFDLKGNFLGKFEKQLEDEAKKVDL